MNNIDKAIETDIDAAIEQRLSDQDLCLELKILIDRWCLLQDTQSFTETEWRRMSARIKEIRRLLGYQKVA